MGLGRVVQPPHRRDPGRWTKNRPASTWSCVGPAGSTLNSRSGSSAKVCTATRRTARWWRPQGELAAIRGIHRGPGTGSGDRRSLGTRPPLVARARRVSRLLRADAILNAGKAGTSRRGVASVGAHASDASYRVRPIPSGAARSFCIAKVIHSVSATVQPQPSQRVIESFSSSGGRCRYAEYAGASTR